MNLLPDTATQLCLPLAPKRPEPAIADAGDVVHQRRPDSHKLPAELTDAELLTKVLGPSTALSCEWLATTYDDPHTMQFPLSGAPSRSWFAALSSLEGETALAVAPRRP